MEMLIVVAIIAVLVAIAIPTFNSALTKSKEAADIASLNQDYFCRMFKKCMGVTFLEYVNQVRINHIHEELLATEDSITDILEHNGFTNYKVFSRMFKAQFGMTPRELRKLQEN